MQELDCQAQAHKKENKDKTKQRKKSFQQDARRGSFGKA